MNIDDIRKDIIITYSDKNIHEQVLLQLAYLKYWVLSEEKHKERCNRIRVPYTPSRRKDEYEYNEYNEYKKELEKNGDKNLLVMVKEKDGRIVPYAKREVYRSYGTYFLIHRFKHSDGYSEILCREDEVEIIDKAH